MSDTTEALEAELREYAGPIIEGGYKPFDQDERIRHWRHSKPSTTDVEAWEAGHGHDVRLKCYPEFQCQAIETHLGSLITRALDALAAARTENERLRRRITALRERADRLADETVEAWDEAEHYQTQRNEARAALAEANRKIEEALAELSDYTFAGLGNALAILSTDPNPTEGNTDV